MAHSHKFQGFDDGVQQTASEAENFLPIKALLIRSNNRISIVMNKINFPWSDLRHGMVILVNDRSGRYQFDGQFRIVEVLEKAGAMALSLKAAFQKETSSRPDRAGPGMKLHFHISIPSRSGSSDW